MKTAFTSSDPAEPKADHDACDHDWEFCDDSFDHEYGCERIHFWRCSKCEAEKPTNSADFSQPDDVL